MKGNIYWIQEILFFETLQVVRTWDIVEKPEFCHVLRLKLLIINYKYFVSPLPTTNATFTTIISTTTTASHYHGPASHTYIISRQARHRKQSCCKLSMMMTMFPASPAELMPATGDA